MSGRSKFNPEEGSLLTGTEVPDGLAIVLDGRMKRRRRRGVEVKKIPSISNFLLCTWLDSPQSLMVNILLPSCSSSRSKTTYLYSKAQSLPNSGSLPSCLHLPKGAPGSC